MVIIGNLLGVLLELAVFLFGNNGHGAAAMRAFVPAWLVVAGVNTWAGVSRNGNSIKAELPSFVVVVVVPVATTFLGAIAFAR